MAPVHWIIQENHRDTFGIRSLAEALEDDGTSLMWFSCSKTRVCRSNCRKARPSRASDQGL